MAPKTDPAAAPPAAPPADPPAAPPSSSSSKESRPAWAGELKDEILGAVQTMIAPLRQGGSAQQAAQQHEEGKLDRPSNLEQQIAEAIRVNNEATARQAAETDRASRLEKLEQAAAEKPPVDRRRAHRLMGWGEPAQ